MPQPADPTASFTATYDAWNRLVKLVDDTTTHTIATYQYDGAKRRAVEQTYASGTLDETRHCYFTEPSKWQVIEERIDSSSNPECQNVWGFRYIDDNVLRDRDTNQNGTFDERLYILQDASWNVTALSNNTGEVQERYVYSAYGIPTFLDADFSAPSTSSAFNQKYLYTGRSIDACSVLYLFRYRYLDPSLGNFVNRDYLTSESVSNLYVYVDSSPLDWVDPLGLFRVPAGGDCSRVAVRIDIGDWKKRHQSG